MKRFLATTATTAMALTGTALMASPAQAAAPLFAGGLVNVNISGNEVEVLEDVRLGVAASVVATVCDVSVGGILGELRDTGVATCTSENGETVVDLAQA